MTPIDQFVLAVHQQGIKLWLDKQSQLRYKAIRGALTPTLQSELKGRKGEVINFLRQPQVIASLPQATPASEKQNTSFPLTDIQEAYWLGRSEKFDLHAPTHCYEEFAGQGLEPSRLEATWQQLINRHDMLRAIILPSGQQQILAEVPAYLVKCYDLTRADETTINQHLEMVRREMFTQPFSPKQWPLFELRLTQLPDQELRIHFSLDMLIADWGSYDILLREWGQLYHHPEQLLPALSLSFRDYVLAERKIKETELYQWAATYWQERLSSLPTAPELPLALDPSTLKSPQFKRHRAALEPENWSQLKTKATQLGLTATGLLLTVFAEILTRWSKRPQFTLNLTLFNRLPLAEQTQINQIVGDFTSLTMLAIDNSNPADTLAKRAKRLQNQLWQDLEQRYFSGVQVLRALATQQDSIGQSLMPVVFTSSLGVLDKGSNWLGKTVYGLSQTPQVWLDSQIEESEGQLWLTWDVVAALFPPGLIETMFTAYLNLLNRLATEEQLWQTTTLDLLPVSQQQQRQQVNDTRAPLTEELLHNLFIKQATVNPDQPAVIALDRTLSYGQLYQAATQVAHWLHAHGACSNQLVAVVMEKGWEPVVAVMGILMSGAAYVPIDPELPLERQHELLAQSEVRWILTQPHLETQLSWPDTIQRWCIDDKVLTHHELTLVNIFLKSTDLAYVIYTSGSTGQPKGVMIDHRGAVNTILDINQRFGVTSQDRVLALSALNFDLSVYDIFGLLAAGGTIVMPSSAGRRDPSHWVELMTQHGVTLWDTVPPLMQMLVEYQAEHSVNAPLRLVMMSGDWIPLDLPNQIRQLWPEVTLMSFGGATEASIWSIYYPITTIEPSWNSIPYGKPLTNQSFHVLNERLEPCPVWVPGQLYIGGMGLALGYWRDEEKTQVSFFTHPHTGKRLYKTGDLGRYLPDGNIEFLGREDFQVKIRGHRIELGEIESHLLKYPHIKDVIVSAIGNSRHDKQLVAYLVLTENGKQTPETTQPVDQATYGLQVMQGVLTDPIERLQFKLNQPGIRQLEKTLPEVSLPEVKVDDGAYLARQSYRQFLAESITLTQLSQLLSCLKPCFFPEGVLPKYRYGSAGSLYPVQTYLYIKPNRVTDLTGGFYYYHPLNHRLVLLSATAMIDRERHGGTNQVIFDQSAFSLFLVAEYQAIEPMYGPSARDFCLLEAGYMSQLLMMAAPTYELGLCPIGGMDFEPIRTELGLRDSQEMVHSLLGGGIAVEQTKQLTQMAPPEESLEERLKAYLSRKLPRYMVPNSYVRLPELPLTANGKVDRKALPHPDLSNQTTEFIRPSNELERRLVELAQKLFKIESVSLTDDFFELGANSLDMVQLYNEVKAEFQREITIADIFSHTTVQLLAKFLSQAPATITTPSLSTNTLSIPVLDPEQIDQLSANLNNLTDAEVELLLAKLEQK
ncbi:MAG: amino acid adenylation domain-containing protein [Thioploca sp.]|nr:amino acid adenylation domain-containing protein [Thioploca sp.]